MKRTYTSTICQAAAIASLLFTGIFVQAQESSNTDSARATVVNEINKPEAVAIVNFDAAFDRGKTTLTWQSGYNQTASQYDIEYLPENMANSQADFKRVGTIRPVTKNYSDHFTFTHLVNDAAQQVFYRLKIYNTDGSVSFSRPVKVNSQNQTAAKINGTIINNGMVIMQVNQPFEAVEVVSNDGVRVLTKRIPQQIGTVQLQLGDVRKGIYFVHLLNKDASYTHKIIVN